MGWEAECLEVAHILSHPDNSLIKRIIYKVFIMPDEKISQVVAVLAIWDKILCHSFSYGWHAG